MFNQHLGDCLNRNLFYTTYATYATHDTNKLLKLVFFKFLSKTIEDFGKLLL